MLRAGGGHGAIGGAKGGAVGGGKGGGGKIDFAAALGIDKSKDAADQLRQITKQFEKLDSVSRIGLAKKLGISELLPLINQGIDQLDAFTARAKELGLVMSESDARAGKEFGLAFGDLHDVLMSSVKAIGGALVPCITGLTNIVVRVATSVRDWLKDHQALTQMLFYGTGLIVAGGIALKGFSVIAGIAAKGISLLQYAVKGVSIAFSVLSTVVSWLPLLANPWVLAGLAVAGVVAWIAKLSGAFDGLSSVWQGLSQDFSASFGAISNALSKGDIQGAWNVITAFVKTEWIRVTNYLAEAWANFSDYFMQLLDHYAPWVSTTFRAMGKAWDWIEDHWREGLKWLSGAWTTACNFLEKTFGGVVKGLVELWNKLLDKVAEYEYKQGNKGAHKAYMPTEDVIRRKLREEDGMTPEQVGERIAEMKAAGVQFDHHAEDLPFNARKEREKDAKALADKEKAEFEERKRKRAMEADARLQAAHAELKQAIDAANVPGKQHPLGPKGDQAFAAAAAGEIRGTFSGAVAGMLGGGGALAVAQAQLDEEKNQSDIMRAQNATAEKQYEETKKINATIVDINNIA